MHDGRDTNPMTTLMSGDIRASCMYTARACAELQVCVCVCVCAFARSAGVLSTARSVRGVVCWMRSVCVCCTHVWRAMGIRLAHAVWEAVEGHEFRGSRGGSAGDP